ncbi:MAG: GSCFA domain-containing protein, partial [Prevotella sp.]|nr:GSCFA domain-containing protein [Prevotella sp.]
MEFRTKVAIDTPQFKIDPQEQMLFVGSCFADNIGSRFVAENFRAIVNPYGVMYNPASILHTVERSSESPTLAFFTLGTNHIYRLKETGEIVDNCQKRPQRLFEEEELSVDECAYYLSQAIEVLRQRNSDVRIVITVSPIRYAKYGYHGSQLSKSTLLLAADLIVRKYNCCTYFPAYEIVNDELRDYRF